MRFIINSQIFSKQLQFLSGVIPNRNTVPITNCFHFSLEEKTLTVKATDLETTIISRIELESGVVDGISQVAVPSKQLLDLLKSLDDAPITFAVDKNTYSVEITSGEGKYRLPGMNPDTYPTLPKVDNTVSVDIPASTLANAFSKTSFATSTDDTHPTMTGIFCDITTESITFVATDSHRLVRYRRNDIHADEPVSFVLPRQPILQVRNILNARKDEYDVRMEFNNTNVVFSFDNFCVICRLIDGKYPNYEAAIPKENPNKMIVDRVSFLNSLRRVGLFASQATHQVRLTINSHDVVISSEDIEFSTDAKEKMPCQFEGEPIDIGFNAKFLVEMVSNMDSENLLLEMSHPNRAGILFPVAETEEESPESILMLVMPVMLVN